MLLSAFSRLSLRSRVAGSLQWRFYFIILRISCAKGTRSVRFRTLNVLKSNSRADRCRGRQLVPTPSPPPPPSFIIVSHTRFRHPPYHRRRPCYSPSLSARRPHSNRILCLSLSLSLSLSSLPPVRRPALSESASLALYLGALLAPVHSSFQRCPGVTSAPLLPRPDHGVGFTAARRSQAG